MNMTYASIFNSGTKKHYKYLYTRMLKEDVIKRAFNKMKKGKTKRPIIINIGENLDRYTYLVKEMLTNTIKDPENGFKPPKHKPRIINEYGKEREIYIPSIIEQWVHHIIMQVMSPIFMKYFHHNSFGSVPKKGLHKCGRLIKKWRSQRYRYAYKLDVRHFYMKIRLDILIEYLKTFIEDDWMIYIIHLCFKWFKRGLPLGFYLSQWLANVYLMPLDDLIRQRGFKHARYVDDMIIVSNNKRKLKRLLSDINILLGKLRLRIKNNYKFMRFSEDISFVGFVFRKGQMRLRKCISAKMKRIAKSIHKVKLKLQKVWIKQARRITSMMGWINISDSYTYYLRNVQPYVIIKQMKHIVSKYDKKERMINNDKLDIRRVRPQTRAA